LAKSRAPAQEQHLNIITARDTTIYSKLVVGGFVIYSTLGDYIVQRMSFLDTAQATRSRNMKGVCDETKQMQTLQLPPTNTPNPERDSYNDRICCSICRNVIRPDRQYVRNGHTRVVLIATGLITSALVSSSSVIVVLIHRSGLCVEGTIHARCTASMAGVSFAVRVFVVSTCVIFHIVHI
jgi:hypothetical protein